MTQLRISLATGYRAALLPGVLIAILGLQAGPAGSQGIGLPQKTRLPVTINADDGVEWRQKEQVYIARGNATASRGTMSIRADVLRAHYRKPEKKKSGAEEQPASAGGDKKPGVANTAATQIYKITATGKVVIKSDKDTITGDQAVYLVDRGVFILTGRGGVKIQSKDRTITGGRIEYHTRALRAYVLGNAKVVDGDKQVTAKRFVAYLKKGPGGGTAMRRVLAEGNVIIKTKREVAMGDRGDYDTEKKIATLTGNVRLTRGDNQLNGNKAVVNMATGVSRMVGKVRILMVPREGEGGIGLPGTEPRPANKDGKKKSR